MKFKTIRYLDWADGYRGPAWYETTRVKVPATQYEIEVAGGKPIVEVVYGRLDQTYRRAVVK